MKPVASPLAGESMIRIDPSQSIESVIVQLSSSPEDERAVVADVDDTCADALRLFTTFDLHHLPVVSGGRLKGIVSTTDLLNLLRARPGVLLDSFRLSEIMTRDPHTLGREAPLLDAITQLAESSYRCLPVLSDKGEPWSIITTRDLVRLLHQACVTE
jgi:CBS domain-containing protein